MHLLNFDLTSFGTACSPLSDLFVQLAFFVKGFFRRPPDFFRFLKVSEVLFGLLSVEVDYLRDFFSFEVGLPDEPAHLLRFKEGLSGPRPSELQPDLLRKLFRVVLYHCCIVQLSVVLCTRSVGIFPHTIKLCDFFKISEALLQKLSIFFLKLIFGKRIFSNLILDPIS